MTRTRLARRAVATALAVGIGFASWTPVVHADDLTDQRDRLNTQAAQQQAAVNESSAGLQAATATLAKSREDLSKAEGVLAVAQQAVAAAKIKDSEMAARLGASELRLSAAEAAVTKKQGELDAAHKDAGVMALTEYQQNTSLVGVATLVSPTTSADVSDRLQWVTTMFDTQQAKVDRLNDARAQLAVAKDQQAVLQTQATSDRQAAAGHLGQTKQAESQAAGAQAAVQKAVAANQAAEKAAADALAADQAILNQIQAEQQDVNGRIAARIAAQKAAEEAARQAAAKAAQEAAARAAAQAAAEAAARQQSAAQQAAAAAAASQRAQAQAAQQAASNAAAASSSSSSSFIYPVDASITSPYGMRLHPVLKVWKLHDGTDFGAGCGTSIRAAASGTVTEEYFNAGYGNRIFIDHGQVGGRYVTTAYNHLSGYAVSVGQRVTQGQIIGYVGTTGYSTGCHLHLMVWINGTMVNPMTIY